jgi:hypothetical protein
LVNVPYEFTIGAAISPLLLPKRQKYPKKTKNIKKLKKKKKKKFRKRKLSHNAAMDLDFFLKFLMFFKKI